MGAKFSATVQPDPVAHPASYTMGTGSPSRGVKWPGRGVDHPTPSSAKVKERVELYLYSPLRLRGLFYGELYLYLYFTYAFIGPTKIPQEQCHIFPEHMSVIATNSLILLSNWAIDVSSTFISKTRKKTTVTISCLHNRLKVLYSMAPMLHRQSTTMFPNDTSSLL